MVIDDSYLIFKNDFRKRNWIDWIKSHIMGAPPPHRYKGTITLNYNELSFNGLDTYAKENTEFNIKKHEINQLYYGYDNVFSTFQTRGMGMSWAPIRFTIELDASNNETFLYLVSGFNGAFSENKNLFEELKMWLA